MKLLLTSPRLPAGLLSRSAWSAIESAASVWARDAADPLAQEVTNQGITVHCVGDVVAHELASQLLAADAKQDVLWLNSPDGDPGLHEALAAQLTSAEDPAELEIVVGSWDPPGARLLDVVAVMDRLRSPGGCPWDAEQTHASLTPYLVEEAFEAVEALDSGDPDHMSEELGDVLLQVLFHARVAEENADAGFDIDEIAAGLVAKLVRRHPHVFADGDASNPDEVALRWDEIKAQEKPERGHVFDGIPGGMPELAKANKFASRLEKHGLGAWLSEWIAEQPAEIGSTDAYGLTVLGLVLRARADGVDLSAATRETLRKMAAAVPSTSAN